MSNGFVWGLASLPGEVVFASASEAIQWRVVRASGLTSEL
jgi:hypothetical protein